MKTIPPVFNGSFWSFTVKHNICYNFLLGTNYQVMEIYFHSSVAKMFFVFLSKWLCEYCLLYETLCFKGKGESISFITTSLLYGTYWVLKKKLLNKWQSHWYHFPIQTLSTAFQCWRVCQCPLNCASPAMPNQNRPGQHIKISTNSCIPSGSKGTSISRTMPGIYINKQPNID